MYPSPAQSNKQAADSEQTQSPHVTQEKKINLIYGQSGIVSYSKTYYHLQFVYDLWQQTLLYITTRKVHQYNLYGWQFENTYHNYKVNSTSENLLEINFHMYRMLCSQS